MGVGNINKIVAEFSGAIILNNSIILNQYCLHCKGELLIIFGQNYGLVLYSTYLIFISGLRLFRK